MTRIINKTRGTVLCESCELADTPWQRSRGLMLRKALPLGHGLLMAFDEDSRPGIWMMGMRFPIDIVFLDSMKRVVHVVENAMPIGLAWRSWKLFYPPGPVRFVLELPAGKARASRTRQHDVLEF